MNKPKLSRRNFLRAGLWGASGLASVAALSKVSSVAALNNAQTTPPPPDDGDHSGHHGAGDGAVGDVDLTAFDPSTFLTNFDYGRVSTTESGQPLREWDVNAINKDIEIAPGV